MLTSLLKVALKNIWTNKARSFLTTIGVLIGVFAVVSLIAIGQGVKEDVSGQIKDLGTNILIILPGDVQQSSGGMSPGNLISGDVLTKNDLQRIRKTEGIELASPFRIMGGIAGHKNVTSKSGFIIGFSKEAKELFGVEIEKGKFFTNQDEKQKKKVVFLGANIKEELFGKKKAINKQITINQDEFKVVGILKEEGAESILGEGSPINNFVVMPFSTAEKITDKVEIHRIIATFSQDTDIEQLKETINNDLEKVHPDHDFSVLTQEDLLDFMSQILDILTLFISGIAAISLLVGGIGIMNIMLVSVIERTKEIGIRKAVGASTGAIMTQFLIEAIILSLIGGILGVLLSYLASYLIATYTILAPAITTNAIVLAVSVSIGEGIIFGLLPAIRAARLDPIKALRYE